MKMWVSNWLTITWSDFLKIALKWNLVWKEMISLTESELSFKVLSFFIILSIRLIVVGFRHLKQ